MLDGAQETRLDPRIRRTRALLRRALEELMTERSFQSVTVQEIATRATVNRATFYAHYDDKYALLEDSVRERFRERLARVLPQGSGYSAENLGRLIQAVCDFLAEMRGHCPPPHAQFEPLMERQVKVELNELLSGWLLTGEARGSSAGPPPDLVAGVASWAIYGAAEQWSKRRRPGPSSEFARQAVPLVLPILQGSRKAARRMA
jgi:AcrR family transcriptional regulator